MDFIGRIRKKVMEDNPNNLEKYQEYLDRQVDNSFLNQIKKNYYLMQVVFDNTNNSSLKKERSVINSNKLKDIYRNIEKYDVISFDIFDTLLIRKIEKPTDVFLLLEEKLNYPGFANLRHNTENELRRINGGSREVNIYEIYEELQRRYDLENKCGINVRDAINLEYECERKICFRNPFMYRVYKKAVLLGKKIIAVSEMYFPEKFLKKLLSEKGYDNLDKVYVSCDTGVSKQGGRLYRYIENQIHRPILHIGDNYKLDYLAANGTRYFRSVRYKNVYECGRPYRKNDDNTLANAIYNGMVNFELYNGYTDMNGLQRFGYVYGGIITAGYCNWLYETANKEGFTKLLFVSRDGYIFQKVFDKRFNQVDNSYIYTSRRALMQLTFEYSIEDYLLLIRRQIKKGGYTVGQVLKVTGLDKLQELIRSENIDLNSQIDKKIYEQIRNIFYSKKTEISKLFEKNREAARQYFSEVIGNHKKICVVDTGWAGTSTILIKRFLEDVCKMDVTVYGAQLGSVQNNRNRWLIANGYLLSYAFSPLMNRDIMKKQGIGYNNLIFEIMFSAPHATLLSYETPDVINQKNNGQIYRTDSYTNLGNEPFINIKIVREIHKGITRFTEEYYSICDSLGIDSGISGQLSYMPLLEKIYCDKSSLIKLLGDYVVHDESVNNKNKGIRLKNIK